MQFEPAVEFRLVSFAYPSRLEAPVFKGFSLEFPAHRTTAVVGSSGGGKSTVVSLLLRYYGGRSADMAFILLPAFPSVCRDQPPW